jgi:hypothetical protein
VPSSRDLEELKRRLAEMEELLDGLSARLARAEAHEASADDTDTDTDADTDDQADDDDADEPAKEDPARS